MIATFGCGIGDDFDISKLRYDKIIILTDADVDGAHISTLLLTFFYRFMPDLIKEGKIYRGLPPLYKVDYEESGAEDGNVPEKKLEEGQLDIFQLGVGEKPEEKQGRAKSGKKRKKSEYIFNDYELEKFKKNKNRKILEIQRYKGLGEMMEEQLWETTMNPENRILKQITIESAASADRTFSMLMGEDVPPRREFIEDNATYARIDA